MNLDQLIHTETTFITDAEEIVDTISDHSSVFLYDTAAISAHEVCFSKSQDLALRSITKNSPILITETVAKEMRLVEDTEARYLKYLMNFGKILYVKEENLLDLLKVDFEVQRSRTKFLIASDRAFSSIQLLKEKVREARNHFSIAERKLFAAYEAFFASHDNRNKGELSLLWTAAIIEQLSGSTHVTFVGIDHDLYDYVERSYFISEKASPFTNSITYLSNDTMIQNLYRNGMDIEALKKLIEIHRKPDRKLRYFSKINKMINPIQQKGKLTNEEFLQCLQNDAIEIIY